MWNKITFDTNIFANLKRDTLLNDIKELFEIKDKYNFDYKIVSRSDYEVEQISLKYKKEKEKIKNLFEKIWFIYSDMRWNVSKWNSWEKWWDENNINEKEEIKSILFWNKNIDYSKNRNDVFDIDIIYTHIKNKRNIFITENKNDFIDWWKREKLELKYKIKVLTLKEFFDLYGVN